MTPDFREDSPYNVIDGVYDGRPGPDIAYGGRKWPRCWHNWKTTSQGAWGYGECKRCGRRKAWRSPSLMGPVDLRWVLTGLSDLVPPTDPGMSSR